MKELTKILRYREFQKTKTKEERQNVVAQSVYEYLGRVSPIINFMAIENSLNEFTFFNAKSIELLTHPNKNPFMNPLKIKYKKITDIVREIIGEKKGFEIEIQREGFGNNLVRYVLFKDKEKCYKIIKEHLKESAKILKYTLTRPESIELRQFSPEKIEGEVLPYLY